MKAALYTKEGPADVLGVTDIKTPGPGPGEVRVRIAVSAINPTDVKIRAGLSPRPIVGHQVPHMDGAGVIDAVGAGVALDRVGERVWLLLAADGNPWGTAAQWCVVPADHAIPLPDDCSFELGASLGVPALTAAHALLADGPIEGKEILVAGGAGAVGRAAIQLGVFLGARVLATASTAQKQGIAMAAGAELVVDYRKDSAAKEIQAASSGIDRIIELNLGMNLDLDLAVLRPGGTIVLYASDGPDPMLPVRACMIANLKLEFMLLYNISKPAREAAIVVVQQALSAGALDVLIAERLSLDEIVRAHQLQESGPTGRVLITLDS
jgi:NADPH2:quinone reductase